MQESQGLSTQFRLIPYRPQGEENEEEKVEDQLDRLVASIQQVVAGARMMQLEDLEPVPNSIVTASHTRTHTRRNSDRLDSEELNMSCLHSQAGEFEPLEYENFEVIDYLATLLEKTQMENEDLRSLSIRTTARYGEEIRESKRKTIAELWDRLGIPKQGEGREEDLVAAVQVLRKWEINCTMEEVSGVENALMDVLKNPTQDVRTELKLGTRTFSMNVKKMSGSELSVSKRRIATSISSNLNLSIDVPPFKLEDSPVSSPIEPLFSHADCERTIEELRQRLDFMKTHMVHSEELIHLDHERQYLRRAERDMKAKVESLQIAKREMEELKAILETQIDDVKITAKCLKEEKAKVEDLKCRLTQKQESLLVGKENREIERKLPEVGKTIAVHSTPEPSNKVLALKQKIEELVSSNSATPEPFSFSDNLPEGDLKELEKIVKQAVSLILAETANVEETAHTLNGVEKSLAKINPRKAGFRRVKSLLVSARNKLINLKSKIALTQASDLMTNLNSNIKVLGKTWKQSPPLEFSDLPQKPIVDFEEVHKTVAERPVTPAKTCECTATTPATEERDGRRYSDAAHRDESTIARLRQQLDLTSSRLKDIEEREEKSKEKESMLRTFERQLEVVSVGLEKRVRLVAAKESNLQLREMNFLAAQKTSDGEAAAVQLLAQMIDRAKKGEKELALQFSEIQQERIQLAMHREETLAKEASLTRLQQALSQESLKLASDQQKMDSLRQELYLLLPSLDVPGKHKE